MDVDVIEEREFVGVSRLYLCSCEVQMFTGGELSLSEYLGSSVQHSPRLLLASGSTTGRASSSTGNSDNGHTSFRECKQR